MEREDGLLAQVTLWIVMATIAGVLFAHLFYRIGQYAGGCWP